MGEGRVSTQRLQQSNRPTSVQTALSDQKALKACQPLERVRQHENACAYLHHVPAAWSDPSAGQGIAADVQIEQQRQALQTESQPHTPHCIDAALAQIQRLQQRTLRSSVKEHAPAASLLMVGAGLLA
jgi:hypothetical protein